MLNNWRYYINFKWEKIRDRCRKGIPHSLRSQAWFYLCGGHIQKRRNPHLFSELLNKDIPDDVKNDIFKDLHRQFPMHELFADRNGTGQTDLFNVLKAFAVYKPKIGYCQAQGPIAAVLLMHMPQEHAFWSLVALSDYYISGYFIHNLEEIEIHGQMLFAFLKRFSPNSHSLLVSFHQVGKGNFIFHLLYLFMSQSIERLLTAVFAEAPKHRTSSIHDRMVYVHLL